MKLLTVFLLAILWLNCAAERQPLTEVALSVQSGGSIQIGNKSIQMEDLIKTLTEMGANQETRVTITHDAEVTMETVQKVQSLLVSMKITRITLSAG